MQEHRTGCRVGKDASPDGKDTSRVFATWPDLAVLLAMVPDEPLYNAVVDMAHLLRDLYHTYQVGPCPQCWAIGVAFREHCAPGSSPTTFFFWRMVQTEFWRTFSMAMFSNDIVESLNEFLKHAFNQQSAKGGGKQKVTGQSARGRPEASTN